MITTSSAITVAGSTVAAALSVIQLPTGTVPLWVTHVAQVVLILAILVWCFLSRGIVVPRTGILSALPLASPPATPASSQETLKGQQILDALAETKALITAPGWIAPRTCIHAQPIPGESMAPDAP